jgi:hypothetical protein
MLCAMRRLSLLLATLMLSATLACGSLEPTPPPNRDFVGGWVSKDGTAKLAISAEGKVNYARSSGGSNTTIDAPAQAWTDSSFTVGAMGISTDFTIEKAPTQIDGIWHMTVDGVEYTRPSN